MLDSDEINFFLKRRRWQCIGNEIAFVPIFAASLSLMSKETSEGREREELKRAENLILMGETEAEGSSIIIYKEPSLLIFNPLLAHTHTQLYPSAAEWRLYFLMCHCFLPIMCNGRSPF